MNFIISSLSEEFISRIKGLFIKTNTKYRIIKRPSKIPNDIDLSVCLVDIDSIQNMDELNCVKNNENIINAYFLTKDVYSTGVDFPKMNIIDSFLNETDLIKIINENSMKFMELTFLKNAPKTISQEEAMKSIPKSDLPQLSTPEETKDSDDFDIPIAPKKKVITIAEAVNEDEDDFDDFEDREDLHKYETQRQNSKETKRNSYVTSKPHSPAKNALIVDEEEEETSPQITKEELPPIVLNNPKDINEVFYKNNEREDKDLTDIDYVSSLNLPEIIKCPKINGHPMEFIDFGLRPKIDKTLTTYRINKLKKKGLEKLEIIDTLAEINKNENQVRSQQLKERDRKRQEFIKKLESSSGKIEVQKVDSTSQFSEKKDFSKIFGDNIPDLGPKKVDKEVAGEGGFVPREAVIHEKKEKEEIKIELPKEQIELGKQIRQEARKTEMDEASLLEAFQRQRAINAENAKKDLVDIQKGKQSISDLSMKLPQRKMIERSPMAKVYESENIKRAESKTEIKRTRPPEEPITLDDEENDTENPKKGGLFGFFKKKK